MAREKTPTLSGAQAEQRKDLSHVDTKKARTLNYSCQPSPGTRTETTETTGAHSDARTSFAAWARLQTLSAAIQAGTRNGTRYRRLDACHAKTGANYSTKCQTQFTRAGFRLVSVSVANISKGAIITLNSVSDYGAADGPGLNPKLTSLFPGGSVVMFPGGRRGSLPFI